MSIRLLFFLLVVSLYACGQQATVKRHIPNPQAKKLADSAWRLMADPHQSEVAISLLNQSIQLDSDYTQPYLLKLSFLWQKKQYDSCLEITGRLIRLHPKVDEFYGQTGMLYYLKGDSTTSKKFFTKAVSICNGKLDAMTTQNDQYNFLLLNKGVYLLFSDKPEEANEIFEKVPAKLTNPLFRKHFASFANKSKQELIQLLEKQSQNADNLEVSN